MPHRVAAALLALALFAPLARPGEADPPLPKVVLIGDSIRLGYAPLVAKMLEGKAEVVSAAANGGDSANVLKNLDAWAVKPGPAVVHLNCGLHDLKFDKTAKTHQVPLDQYEKNLGEILARLKKDTKAKVILATTTPIHDERHAGRKANFDRLEADVVKYNAKARAAAAAAGVPVNDLHAVVTKAGPEKLLGKDGTHYTADGSQKLAEAVRDAVLKELDKPK